MSEPVIIGDATLYLADCRDINNILYDAVVTDPVYGVNGGQGGDARNFGKAKYAGSFPDTLEYVRDVCAPVIAGLIETGVPAAVTPGNRNVHFYPPAKDMGCFWQPAACTHGPWGMVTFQPILFYGKDWRAGKGALPSGRQVTERTEKNGHPCPKPLEAWKWLVDKTAAPGTIVHDPFMGSGTTGVACAETGRKFVGIEIEEKYFDIACERIEAAYAQGRLFA